MVNHEKWMRSAIRLAQKGKCAVSPNPMVGACVVRNAKLMGSGYHACYGSEHAEIMALRRAGTRAAGGTLYVTLEPCSTWGKTPPCVAAVIRSEIRHVVIGSLDPNPRNHGRGVRALRNAGIRVTVGVLGRLIEEQNGWFFKYVKRKLPYVTLKMAQSLDGKIATRTGRSRWISSPASRDFVHRLRSEQDAVLVGKNTLYQDNPLLSPRIRIKHQQPGKPWRIALDPEGTVSPAARIFRGDQLTLLAVSEACLKKRHSSAYPAILLPVRLRRGRLDLMALLKKLAALGVAKLLVEGGGETAWSLLELGLVDRAYWIVAPKLIGGRLAKTSVEGDGVRDPNRALVPRKTKVSRLGEDYLFELKF